MVAHCLAKDDPGNARRIFKSALYMLIALGLVTAILLIAASGLISGIIKKPDAKLGFIAIAPSLFLVCVISAFRGFMQGQQDMVPTAISQLIEQLGKVAVALPLAAWGMTISVAHAAAGALLGTSIAEGIALAYIMISYARRKRNPGSHAQDETQRPLAMNTLMKRLAANAIPITLGACIVPLAAFVDSVMLVSRLQQIGFTEARATDLYGLYSGLVLNLINVPTAFSIALSMSLVPAISGFFTRQDFAGVAKQSGLGLRLSFLIGFPCSMGLSLLAEPLLHFFYGGGKISPENISLAAQYLTVSGLTVVLFIVVQTTSSVLQGMRKQRIPMYTLMFGVAAKIILNYVLVGIPSINIHGAPVSSLVCYTVSMVPNIYYVLKYGHMTFDWTGFVVRPALAAAVMSLAVWAGRELMPSGRIYTMVLVIMGVAVYAGAVFLFKAVTPEDLSALHLRIRKPLPKED
jgi:stage V sporulation protein B